MSESPAEELINEAYRKSLADYGENFLSSTSVRKFDSLRESFAEISGLSNSTDDIYIVSAGTRAGNLQVRFKQGNRAGRHTALGIGVIDELNVSTGEQIESLFESLSENVAKGETSYDVILIVGAGENGCRVEAIFTFSDSDLGQHLSAQFPQALLIKASLTSSGRKLEQQASSYIADAELNQRAIDLIHEYKNVILEGPPGSGKTEFAKHLALQIAVDPAHVTALQFHPAYSYEEFILGWKPKEDGAGWERRLGIFPELCQQANQEPPPRVLIIDELNRAEIVSVFGEAFTLIDVSKRSPEWSIPLQGSGSEEHLLYVPENVFIIGTINTADRTAHALDHALRRRFAFLDIPPNFGPEIQALMLDRGLTQEIIDTAIDKVTQINEVISSKEFTLGKGFEISHGYLIPNATITDPSGWWETTRDNRIFPVLRDYFFDDVESLTSVADILREPLE